MSHFRFICFVALVLGVLCVYVKSDHTIEHLAENYDGSSAPQEIDFTTLSQRYNEAIENGSILPELLPVVIIPDFEASPIFQAFKYRIHHRCKDIGLDLPSVGEKFKSWVNLQYYTTDDSIYTCYQTMLSFEYHWRTRIYSNDFIDSESHPMGYAYPLNYLVHPDENEQSGVEYLNEFYKSAIQSGYKDGINLFSIPYDWRLPVHQMPLSEIQTFIEQVVQALGKKVIILGHGYGSNVANFFLRTKPSTAWKNNNIAAFFPIAGAFGGSIQTMFGFLSRRSFFNSMLDVGLSEIGLHYIYENFGSIFNLVPHHIYEDEVLFVTYAADCSRRKEYTQSNMIHSFGRLDRIKLGGAHFNNFKVLGDPRVPVYCMWGDIGPNSTLQRIEYTTDDLLGNYTLIYGPGDGLLLTSSGSHCKDWKSTVYTDAMPVEHNRFFSDDNSILKIISVLEQISEECGNT